MTHISLSFPPFLLFVHITSPNSLAMGKANPLVLLVVSILLCFITNTSIVFSEKGSYKVARWSRHPSEWWSKRREVAEWSACHYCGGSQCRQEQST